MVLHGFAGFVDTKTSPEVVFVDTSLCFFSRVFVANCNYDDLEFRDAINFFVFDYDYLVFVSYGHAISFENSISHMNYL
jgi:hypothetical protein